MSLLMDEFDGSLRNALLSLDVRIAVADLDHVAVLADAQAAGLRCV